MACRANRGTCRERTKASRATLPAMFGVELQRKISCLQDDALGIGHDGRDHVYELREIRHLHRAAMAMKDVERRGDPERVAQIVNFFEFVIVAALEPRTEPDVPFIGGDFHALLFLALACTEVITASSTRTCCSSLLASCDFLRRVRAAAVVMQRNVIHHFH